MSVTVRKLEWRRKVGATLAQRIERLSIPEPNTGCWFWIGSDANGYGKLKIDGRFITAHRVSFEAFNGPVNGMQVLHRCDQPLCVNPEHLFLGSRADNMADMSRKGRSRPPRIGRRLTSTIAAQIRADASTRSVAARKFGVSQKTISQIRSGETWKTP